MDVLNDFKAFGGVAQPLMQGFAATEETPWNFGVTPKTDEVTNLIQATLPLYARFPNIQGAWDGKSTVNHWTAVETVLGAKATDLIQYQPRGTCGGRSGSAGLDILQCVMIAKGTRAKFVRASHAFLYWQARKKYKMDRGSPNDTRNDGVASGSIPEIMAAVGVDNRDETGDTFAYGPGSDDLACQWGAGKIDPALAAKLEGLARDNIVTAWAPVNSAQELADGIAAGGVGIGSDSQGYGMTRDAEGFCGPRGTWHHYHVRLSVFQAFSGRKGFGYFQSWGKTSPGGTLLGGHPSNCFGVDWDVQDRCCRNGDWAVVFSFPVWELEKGPQDLPWVF
jgi:hypothetical protein